MSYAAIIVSILPSVEVLSRKAPVWYLPNACPHRGSALLPPNLSYQPIEITYSNRLSGEVMHAAPCRASGGGWGGWFVLRADVPEGGAEYVGLGHLAHAGLPQAGARITRGTPIGVIGTPHENGGWYPHLHLQALSGEAW